MWFTKVTRGTLVLVLMIWYDVTECWAITNTQFNASLRDYSAPEDNINSTQVRTLQKDLSERAHQAPVSTIIRFKEVPDSVLSGSSHGRGLLHLNHHGYVSSDYEEHPHSDYGYEYHYPDDHHGHFDDHDHHHPDHHGHHVIYHDDHKHGYGHHHKHYDHHGLAAKTVLWPIAGIALLGAAAALVTNPVLLQLGVVSGRRRRRDADILNIDKFDKPKNEFNTELIINRLKNFNKNEHSITTIRNNDIKRNVVNDNNNRKIFSSNVKTIKGIESNNDANSDNYNKYYNKHYIPIPQHVKIRN